MKRLLFFILCSGAASAMQQDTVPADIINASLVTQERIDLTAKSIDQSTSLTPEQRQQAITQATKNVQEIVAQMRDNDKELLESMLMQRIEKLEKAVFGGNTKIGFAASSVSLRELALPLIVLCVGIGLIVSTFNGDRDLAALFALAIFLCLIAYKQSPDKSRKHSCCLS
jgi:hypothetical protein